MRKIIAAIAAKLTAAIFLSVFTSVGANAAVMTITFQEVGSDVVISGSGSFDLTGMTLNAGTSGSNSFISPNAGIFNLAPNGESLHNFYSLADAAPFSGFGPGGFTQPTSGSGDFFGVNYNPFDNERLIAVPLGYVSLSMLTASITFANATFASLGITPGNYQLSFANNNIVYNVLASEVPLPTALPLFLAGVAGLGFAKRKRKTAAA